MKTLSTWNPLREMEEFQNRFTTLFGGIPTFPVHFPKNGERFKMPDWSPMVDITEDDREYLFKADLPEMRKDDVKVTIENGVLHISGERKSETKHEDSEVYRSERFVGKFQRTVTLPTPVKSDAVKANYKDGILTVTLPKAEEAKPKQIDVNVS